MRLRWGWVVIAVAVVAEACGAPPAAKVDSTGILLVDVGEQIQARPGSEEMGMAFNAALEQAEAHGDALGYPWIDPGSAELVLSTVNQHGRELIGPVAITVPHRIREVRHGATEVRHIQDDVTFLRSRGVAGGELIYQTVPDQRDNRALLVISAMSRPLLDYLAAHYPPDALAVQVDPSIAGPSRALLGRANWWVDPSELPLATGATVIHGHLQEQACASGQSPAGRIAGPTIEYRSDAVVVTFSVRTIGGRCPSNPTYPVTVELTEPLGTRTLIDGGTGRDATIDPTVVLEPDEDCGPLVGTNDTKIACMALINAALGDEYPSFAQVSVGPNDFACGSGECTTLASIAARAWRVDGTDRAGKAYSWLCTYSKEAAAGCVPDPTRSPNPHSSPSSS
jgi:hypothetical protein